MKKLFLILFLTCNFVMHGFSVFKTASFRWRNDNGTETSATWKAATNAPITLTSRNQNIRLRLNIRCQTTIFPASPNTKVSYSKNGGPQVEITNDTSNDFVLSSSSFVATETTTTNQLPTAYTYVNGYFVSDIDLPPIFNLIDNQSTEVEFCIRATDAASNESTYAFYSYNSAVTYENQPATLTTQFCVTPPTPTTNFSSDGINYVVTSPTTAAIADNTSVTGVVVIPDAVTVDCGTLAVTSIAANAFSGCSGLTSVSIPSTVTSINSNAFENCTSLTSVICNVTTPIDISGLNVFQNVNQAACSLAVPYGSIAAYQAAAIWQNFAPIVCNPSENITNVSSRCSYTWANNGQTYTTSGIYTGVTANCVTEKLNLNINPIATNFSSGGVNYVITSPTTVMVGSNPGASGAVVIPATVTTTCGTYAVTSIFNYAFQNCSGLTSVAIPNSVTSINTGVFDGCTGLTSVTIPNSVTSIGLFAFKDCSSLTSITIPNSVTSIGESAFQYCYGLTSVTIPNSVTSIVNNAFYQCTSLTSVTIGNSVSSIGINAFNGCSSLSSIICNVTTPITISNTVFANVNQAACSLAVPIGSVAAYQAASVWQNFYIIINDFSKIIDSQCGANLPALNTLIKANAISGASNYRFKVVNGTTTQIIEPTNGRLFRLTSLTGGAFYNTAYTISVAVKKDNVWGDYGDECVVTTPAFPATEIQNAQCGNTLSALNSLISANAVSRASGYRFKVVNGASTEIIESSYRRWFRLTSLPSGALYNTTYTISVATKYNSVWSDYGTECTITTPAFPLTKVQDSQCGVTLASINTFISADAVNAASGYRFKVVNQTSEETIEAVSGSRWFCLTSLSDGALYNTTYTISVASKYNGVWSNYGNECAVTTPAAPLTKLTDRQCGMTLASGNVTELHATAVSVAQKYRFEVSLGADVYTYDTASSSARSFRMINVPGLTLVNGTTYAVRVASMINDAWQPYGESCTITTFGVAPNFVKTINVDTTNFNVLTYPNPFTENFNLNLTSLSEEKVTVMVYDMIGKLLERKEVVPSELSELQIGNNYASGIYNVIVSQGANTKSLRVIKK